MTRTQSQTNTAGSTSDIIALIRAEIPPASDRHRPWWLRVAPEHVETVAAIHSAWHDGIFGTAKYPAARAISTKLRDLGIDIGEQGVVRWLSQAKS
jgi:hypothetical protein